MDAPCFFPPSGVIWMLALAAVILERTAGNTDSELSLGCSLGVAPIRETDHRWARKEPQRIERRHSNWKIRRWVTCTAISPVLRGNTIHQISLGEKIFVSKRGKSLRVSVSDAGMEPSIIWGDLGRQTPSLIDMNCDQRC